MDENEFQNFQIKKKESSHQLKTYYFFQGQPMKQCSLFTSRWPGDNSQKSVYPRARNYNFHVSITSVITCTEFNLRKRSMRHVAITTSFPPPRKIPAPHPPPKVNLYYLNVADPLILIF